METIKLPHKAMYIMIKNTHQRHDGMYRDVTLKTAYQDKETLGRFYVGYTGTPWDEINKTVNRYQEKQPSPLTVCDNRTQRIELTYK